MIEFKDNKIKVQCLECEKEHFIEVNLSNFEKFQRKEGFEKEYTYKGKLKCSHCNEIMKIKIIIYEYPKGIYNTTIFESDSCLIIDNLSNYKEEDFNILDLSDDEIKLKLKQKSNLIQFDKEELNTLIEQIFYDMHELGLLSEKAKNILFSDNEIPENIINEIGINNINLFLAEKQNI
jgi:hypothetical protein